MGTRLLIIKQRLDYLLLIKQLSQAAEEVVSDLKKDLEWLKYAEEENGVYKFLPNVEERWKTLEKIAKRVKEQSDYSISYISETLSHLVNTRVIDEIGKHNLKLKKEILNEHNNYLMSILLNPNVVGKHIPGYYWLMICNKLAGNRCEVLDFSEGVRNIFTKRVTKDYIFYEQLQN